MKQEPQSLLCHDVNPSDSWDTCTREKGHFGSHLSQETGAIWRQEEIDKPLHGQKGSKISRQRTKGMIIE